MLLSHWPHAVIEMRSIATITTLAVAFALGGCGAIVQGYQQAEHEKKVAKVNKQIDAIGAECAAKFPKHRGQYVNLARCKRPAYDLYQSIGGPADLLQLRYAATLTVSEKLDKGTITEAQAELEIAQLTSQLEAETQRRNLAGRSIMANEAMAAEASRANTINTLNNIQRSINPPTVTCTHQRGGFGYSATTTCQ